MRSYIIPVFQALVVHALVIGAFTFNWESKSDRELTPPPQVVQAKVLTMADPVAARRAEEARKKAEAKRRAAEKRKREEAKRKAAEKKKAEAKKKAEEQKRAEEQRRREEAERQRQEQLALEAKQREDELALALEDELAAEQEEEDAIAAQSYIGLIKGVVIQNWHRPLSARNGMQTLLRVNLLPTGEVIDVIVLQSSGNEAFDRSAIQAVERAEKFEELQQLEPRVFDANFRSFKFLFNPQDLDR